jgi:hypothetical protein
VTAPGQSDRLRAAGERCDRRRLEAGLVKPQGLLGDDVDALELGEFGDRVYQQSLGVRTLTLQGDLAQRAAALDCFLAGFLLGREFER